MLHFQLQGWPLYWGRGNRTIVNFLLTAWYEHSQDEIFTSHPPQRQREHLIDSVSLFGWKWTVAGKMSECSCAMSVKEKSAPKEFMVVRGDWSQEEVVLWRLRLLIGEKRKNSRCKYWRAFMLKSSTVLPFFLCGWYLHDPFSDFWVSKEVS